MALPFAEDFPALAQRASALTERIRIAFAGVPKPRITRSVAIAFDDEWNVTDRRIDELNALDPEQEWTDLIQGDLDSETVYFSFADDEGWRFYLPAYMTMDLGDLPMVPWSIVYIACKGSTPRFGLLNDSQLNCIHEFIRLVDDCKDL